MAKRTSPKEYRSRKAIKNAFVALLEDCPYQEITTQSVIERSDYSKGTFYAHFKDKEDLAQQIIQDEVDVCVSCNTHYLSEIKENGGADELLKYVNPGTLAYFEHVYQHRALYRLIAENKFPEASLSSMADMNARQYMDVFHPGELEPPYDKLNWELFTYQTSHLYMQYIAYWVSHKFEFSPQYMAEQANLLMRTEISFTAKRKR